MSKNEKITITIPREVKEKLYHDVPARERSHYISQAVSDALNQREKQNAFQAILKFKPFNVAEDSVDVIRRIRRTRLKES